METIIQQIKSGELDILEILRLMKSYYNEEFNLFDFPDIETKTIILPGKALLYLTVVGGYIWEFKTIDYKGNSIIAVKLTDIEVNYNKDSVNSIVFNVFKRSLSAITHEAGEILPNILLDIVQEKILKNLMDQTIVNSQLEKIEEEIEWIEAQRV